MKNTISIIHQLGEKVGSGMENNCYIKYNQDKNPSIIKIPNWLGKLWQTQGAEFMTKCLEALKEEDINTIQTTIHQNVKVAYNNGKRSDQKIILEQQYIEDINEYTIDYADLFNEELHDIIKETLIELVHKADKLYKEKNLGLDLLGGETLNDLSKGIYQTLKLKLSNILPGAIGRHTRNTVPGIRGEIRNLIMQRGEITLIDPGMHDFSETGKIKFLTRAIHHVSIATLIELINIMDPEYDTSQLPYNGPKHIEYISKKAIRMCVPLFELHKKRGEEITPPLAFPLNSKKELIPKSRPKSIDL